MRESTILNDVNLRDNSSLISQGAVTVDGDISSWKNGIRTIATQAGHTITAKGSIFGVETGIWTTSPQGMEIDNEADVSANDVMAVLAESESGAITIRNMGDLSSQNTTALVVLSDTGDIQIHSPGVGADVGPVAIDSADDGIMAQTGGAIDIEFSGEVTSIANILATSAMAIHADSSGGPVSVRSQGIFSTSGVHTGGGAGGGIWAKAAGDVLVKHEGRILGTGWGIFGKSSGGNVEIDSRKAFLSTESGGLIAEAPEGTATVMSGVIATTNGSGVKVVAGDDVVVTSEGTIETISGIQFVSSSGIETESTNGGISISNRKEIGSIRVSQRELRPFQGRDGSPATR